MSTPGIGIIPVNRTELKKKWENLLKRVKTKEDFNKLSDKEKELFIVCNTTLAPSFSLKSAKST